MQNDEDDEDDEDRVLSSEYSECERESFLFDRFKIFLSDLD